MNLDSIEDHIRLKDPQRHKAKLLELVYNQKEKGKEITQQLESEDNLFECYYCIVFQSTTNMKKYEEYVVLKHSGLPPYPSISELKRLGISPQGKEWEI